MYLMRYEADLSNLTSSDDYINEAIHKAEIDFSNEGIKAAAVTAFAGMNSMSALPSVFQYNFDVPVVEIDLTFNKPYLYLIRDKSTGELWFVGTVYQPTIQ
jgi:serine protease inhibitor